MVNDVYSEMSQLRKDFSLMANAHRSLGYEEVSYDCEENMEALPGDFLHSETGIRNRRLTLTELGTLLEEPNN